MVDRMKLGDIQPSVCQEEGTEKIILWRDIPSQRGVLLVIWLNKPLYIYKLTWANAEAHDFKYDVVEWFSSGHNLDGVIQSNLLNGLKWMVTGDDDPR